MHVSAYMRAMNLEKIGRTFNILGDERRLRILDLLLRNELCVCELVDSLGLRQYEVSRHLAQLKRAHLVSNRRDGLWAYYSVPDSVRRHPFVGELLALLSQSTMEASEARNDLKRLEKRLGLRGGNLCVLGLQS